MSDIQNAFNELQREVTKLERGRHRAVRVIENSRPRLMLALQEAEYARAKLQASRQGQFSGDILNEMTATLDHIVEYVARVAGWMDAEREALKTPTNFSFMASDLDVVAVIEAFKQGYLLQEIEPSAQEGAPAGAPGARDGAGRNGKQDSTGT
jgi:hypothetical protein